MWDSHIYSDQGWDRFPVDGPSGSGQESPNGQSLGQHGTGLLAVWDQGGAFRHPGTSPRPTLAVVALTGSQKLSFAIVALVAVVVLLVWPMVRPKHYSKRELDDTLSHERLKREIGRHADD